MGKDFEGTGDEAADAARFTAVVAKPEFVEVDLEVSSTDGAVVRANPESPDQGNRVVGFLNRLPRSSGEPIDDNLPVPPATDRRPVVRPIAIGGDTVPSTDVSFDIGTASSVPSSASSVPSVPRITISPSLWVRCVNRLSPPQFSVCSHVRAGAGVIEGLVAPRLVLGEGAVDGGGKGPAFEADDGGGDAFANTASVGRGRCRRRIWRSALGPLDNPNGASKALPGSVTELQRLRAWQF
jgi:hypothetical protein